MRDYFNELYEWDANGNKRRKQRVAADGERFRFTMQMMDAAGFRAAFADGSPDHTSPHRPGYRFADTDDAARLAANDAYEERRERMANAWRNKGQQHDANSDAPPPRTASLDELRAQADAAYREKCQRLRNGWRNR